MDGAILVGINEAAARIGIGPSFVKKLVRSGDLPSITIGDRRLIPVDGIHRFVERKRTESMRR